MNADAIVRTIRLYAAGDLLLHHHELMPRAKAVADLIESQAAEIKRLIAELSDCKNELCLKCGFYRNRYLGKCDECRWNKEAST